MLSKICKTLAEELISQRKLLGMSQTRLARLAGISRKCLVTHEGDLYRSASLETLIKVAVILDRHRAIKIGDDGS